MNVGTGNACEFALLRDFFNGDCLLLCSCQNKHQSVKGQTVMFRIKNITIHACAVNCVNKSAAGERNDAKLMVPLEAPSEKSIKYDPRS